MKANKANKELGQHFLKDHNTKMKIVSDHQEEFQLHPPLLVIEVGPGEGAITAPLCERLKSFALPPKLLLFEFDRRFEERLLALDGVKSENIIWGDALAINFKTFSLTPPSVWLVSNLPYNISAPLFINFLQAPALTHLTLMFQKEVADKILDVHGMGSLHALSSVYLECKKLINVAPGAFSPPPQVESTVLSFKRLEVPLLPYEEFSSFEKFLRALFKWRRKQLQKILRTLYPQLQTLSILGEHAILPNRRPEEISLPQLLGLYQSIKKSSRQNSPSV
ncbi:MAG: ribosomal RNA small subunit methyltransferase A [Oligoflexia bacterium]|nr:ribosomal RNA small subunit methyltransferase A [Oligoflexia bacterium]